MERPERPSRPEKVLVRGSGMHPYRERHRIVSSDSESDMEIDSVSSVRISNVRSLGVGVRLQHQRSIIDSSIAMPNPVGNSSSGTSSLSSDPYHIISPGRHIRDSINGDSSLLHQIPSSLLLKDDPCHRGIIYRKRPTPSQHFVSPISDDIDRRSSNGRNAQVVASGSTRIRFLPHHVPNSVCWDSKRFCPGLSSDSLPSEQKLQHTAGSNALHRLVTGASTVGSSQGLLLESSTSTAATERPERDDSRLRTWNSGAGPSDSPAHSDFLRFLYDNSPPRNDSEQIPYVRTEVLAATSSATGSHNGAGTLDLSRPSPSGSQPTLVLPPLHLSSTVTSAANGSAAASSNGTSNPTASSTSSTNNNNNNNNNNSNSNSNNNTNNSSCPVPCNSVEPITNDHPSESSSTLNNGSNIVILSDPMSYELRESQRVPHRRYRLTSSGHSSSMQSDITDHPTRASSHILRALDELRFSPYREPWVNVVSHSSDLVPNAPNDLTTRGTNGDNILSSGFSSAASNPLSSAYRRRMDFPTNLSDEDESDVEDVEDIERVAIGTVEDSDMDDFGSIIDRMQFDGGRNHQALLTHPTENNNQTSDDNPTEQNNSTGNPEGSSAENNGDPAPSTSANDDQLPPLVLDVLPTDNNVNCEEVEETGQDTETLGNSQTMSSAGTGGNVAGADDVIILTPSPRRDNRDNSQPPSQQQEACAATTSQQTDAGQSLAVSNDPAVHNPPTESSEQQNANPINVAQQINEQLMDCQEFNSKLVSLLECPVCMETIVPPINQCKKGHPVCLMCRPKLSACPTCRARFSESRNLLMEKVAEMMLFPCKNAQMGCPVSVQLREKRKHEVSCGFRLYDCIFNSCSWKGFKPELVVHVSSLHKNRVIVGNNQKIRVPLERNIPHTWVLSVLDEVFIVTFVNQDKQLKGCTVYLGDSEKARKYMYEFLICKNRRQISWKEPTYSDDGQGYSFNLCREGFCMASEHKIIEQFLTRSHGFGVDVTIKIEYSEEQQL